MTDDQTYNGWKNYPTWCVNLWLSNDESLYAEAHDRVAWALHDSTDDTVRADVADALKTWVREDLAPDLGASFAADLLGYALDCIDWHEIADSWIESTVEA